MSIYGIFELNFITSLARRWSRTDVVPLPFVPAPIPEPVDDPQPNPVAIAETAVPQQEDASVAPSNGILCDICFLLPKNTAFLPCGHTCCHLCASKVSRIVEGRVIKHCFYCRTQVTGSLTLTL